MTAEVHASRARLGARPWARKAAVLLGGAVLGTGVLALSAPPVTAAPVAGDRVQGHWVTADGSRGYARGYVGSTPIEVDGPAAADVWSFPAPGTQGPIVNVATGACVSVGRAVGFGSATTYELGSGSCASAATWTFTGSTGATLRSTSGLTICGESHGGALATSSVADCDLDLSRLTPVAPTAVPVSILGPGEGSSTSSPMPFVFGTGEPMSKVKVTDENNDPICSALADDNGEWACQSALSLAPGLHTLTATQRSDGATDKTTFTVD